MACSAPRTLAKADARCKAGVRALDCRKVQTPPGWILHPLSGT